MRFLEQLKSKIIKKEAPPELIEVIPRVVVMPHPTPESIPGLKAFFSDLKQEYKVWNLSERSYPVELFGGHVFDYSKPGYPNVPLRDLLILCREMSGWLDSSPGNLLLVHCGANRARSSLAVACLLLFLRVKSDAESAEQFVTRRLGSTLLANGRVYLRAFAGCFEARPMNRHPLRLRKVSLTRAPHIRLLRAHAEEPALLAAPTFRPYLQVFVGSGVVFNSLDG